MNKILSKGISTPIGLLIIIICSVLTVNLLVSQLARVTKEIKEPEIVLPEDETVNWETYRNKEYGFEIKYPPEYEISKETGTNVAPAIKSNSYAQVIFRDLTRYFTQEEIENKKDNFQKIKVDSVETFRSPLGGNMDGGVEFDVLFFDHPKEGMVFNILFSTLQPGREEEIDIFNQMLSTFRFIEPAKKEPLYKEVDVSEEMVEGYVAGYKIGNIEIKLSDRESPPVRGGHFDVYNQGEKIGEGDAGASIFNLGLLAFDYKDNQYIIVPAYLGGASNPSEYYIYMLDENEDLKLITSKEHIGYNKISLEDFLVENKEKLYLKIVEGYSYDRRSITRILFNNYFLIEGDKLIKSNIDFKEEYIVDAGKATWFLEKVINYLLAKEDEKAWEIFYKNIDELYYDEYPPRKVDPEQIKEEILRATKDWENYQNEKYGFGFEYPTEWQVAEENCTTLDNCTIVIGFPVRESFLGSSIFISVKDTNYAKQAIAEIQAIIDENYTTPPETYGVETDYRRESFRYSINNFKNANGIDIYHYNYIAKYSIVERYFYVDTNKNTTLEIKVYSYAVCQIGCETSEDEQFFSEFEDFRKFIDSIELI